MKAILQDQQDAIFSLLAKFGEALASPRRLKIISLLSQGEKSVDQLAKMTGQSLAAASAHLKVLRRSGLVVSRKEGRHVWCHLASENTSRLWLALRALGRELLPEMREIIRDYFENPETLATLPMKEVLKEVRAGRIILLDLRDEDEFSAGHLPGAQHMRATDLAKRMQELPRNRPVMAYCRGPYCIAAITGTQKLQQNGLKVRRLPFSVPEWKAAGLPLDNSST